jgi:very-short-patch-repair endonuclease
MGSYIVDFICLESKLVIEIDGGQHNQPISPDKERDAWLNQHGFRVIRFWNSDVRTNLEGVLDAIERALNNPPPDPLP